MGSRLQNIHGWTTHSTQHTSASRASPSRNTQCRTRHCGWPRRLVRGIAVEHTIESSSIVYMDVIYTFSPLSLSETAHDSPVTPGCSQTAPSETTWPVSLCRLPARFLGRAASERGVDTRPTHRMQACPTFTGFRLDFEEAVDG
ncbi:hypothetical protein BDW22DRAFT_513402 [Trametopsis cervina]|nr:hypothetical protein BDW22DRAFT_513402 [Trametopsis cervina]